MSSVLSEQATRSSEAGVGPADERPLTDQERKIVARLLADPFAFPQSFKTWLIAFLEGSDLSLPLGSVMGLGTLLGLQGGGGSGVFGILPAGLVFPIATEVPPAGTLLCNGAAYQRIGIYERLFTAIGVRWGAGDGSSTFNVPDYQNRMLVGNGPAHPVGLTEGLISALRGPRHHHGLNNHSHGMSHSHTTTINASGTTYQVAGSGSSGWFVPAAISTSYGSSGASFTETSGSGGNTTGGGPADTPAFGVCGVVINY